MWSARAARDKRWRRGARWQWFRGEHASVIALCGTLER
ncbi:hypothetical protein XOCgx_3133 [Xanthomonas oryzae pv. oryzicola]|nr:hypothetical protein XOCgx_3133 [Xanthomonas oryzae pv. oryzicola]